jgi:multicomponent Na+:H+ antiporter subunit B
MLKASESHTLSLIVRTAARSVARLMFLFGFYIVFHGQITHGDGFAGGVIMALGFILLMIVFGREVSMEIISRSGARCLAGLGALLLLMIGAGGLSGSGYFFFNFLGKGTPFHYWSAGIIPLCNFAVLLIVTGVLVGVFAALTSFEMKAGRK